ncbi:MAG TPA: Asd/ArgC dimerization domain-containing protein [Candidatus Acidoferrales bacterium]|nr:Asd/ArgC dimerization domain-containing protein [Candidatus Acidoferrales bacterium]
MPRENLPFRIAIVGASSLRGKELKSVIEDWKWPQGAIPDVVLLDTTVPVGTLAEAGGEPTFIKPLEPESFAGVRFTFFAGNIGEARANWKMARGAGATIIDLTGALDAEPGAAPWIPSLDSILPPPAPAGRNSRGIYISPAPAAILACTLAAALKEFSPHRLAVLFFPPVSEREQPGVDELESQTASLLSFKPFSQTLFDSQVAFNLLAAYGESCRPSLAELRSEISARVAAYLQGRLATPVLQFVQAPVFYGYAFAAFVELTTPAGGSAIESALMTAGVHISSPGEAGLSNVSIAGENQIHIAPIVREAGSPECFWLWGMADNLRLPAVNAAKIAEELLAPRM